MSVHRPQSPSGAARTGTGTAGQRPRAATSRRSSGPTTAPRGQPGTARTSRPPSVAVASEPAREPDGRLASTWPRILTVRALGLFIVACLAFTLLFPTVRSYLAQQGELADMRAQAAAAEERIEELEFQNRRWDDDAYVASQARERLAYVYPGETAFRVLDPETVQTNVNPESGKVVEDGPLDTTFADAPWYQTVWNSVVVAGEVGLDEPDDADD